MKEILGALGIVATAIILIAIIPMIGDMLGTEPYYATGTLSFAGGEVSDGDTVTIGTTTFEFDVDDDGVAGGNISVCTGAALAAAINDDGTTSAIVVAVRSP